MNPNIQECPMADLKDFVQQEMKRQQRAQTVDWSKRKARWLEELEKIFGSIREFLVAAGLPQEQIEQTTASITEDTLGTYSAPALRLRLPAGGQVDFKPVASVIVGGFGRIDVTGPTGRRVKLIAEDAVEDRDADDQLPSFERDWIWNVYPGTGIRDTYKFDEQGLAALLLLVSARS
jgi:hypothetical protein